MNLEDIGVSIVDLTNYHAPNGSREEVLWEYLREECMSEFSELGSLLVIADLETLSRDSRMEKLLRPVATWVEDVASVVKIDPEELVLSIQSEGKPIVFSVRLVSCDNLRGSGDNQRIVVCLNKTDRKMPDRLTKISNNIFAPVLQRGFPREEVVAQRPPVLILW